MKFLEYDFLTKRGILKKLNNKEFFDIKVFGKVNSTNSIALEKSENGSCEGSVYIASLQTEGRGRKGRAFYSPQKTGIYLSVILKPDFDVATSALITCAAATAVASAIDELSGKMTKIKWVNDIFIDNKKVCGILTEAASRKNANSLKYAILGIGVNVYSPKKSFPSEISNIAGSVFDNKKRGIKNLLVAKILDNFYKEYQNLENRAFMEVYRKKQLAVGKDITFTLNGVQKKAYCLSVNDDATLKVRDKDGKIYNLNSGEISIKLN